MTRKKRRKTRRKDLGQWLRQQRDTAGLRQLDIADAVGVQTRTVMRWEQGYSLGALVAALTYLEALDVRLTPAPPGATPGLEEASEAPLERALVEAEALVRTLRRLAAQDPQHDAEPLEEPQ